MDRVINGLSFTKAYLDDLVIYSSTWQEHLSHVEQIFIRLKKAGLTIKLIKYQLAMEECTYLGHVIGGTEQIESCRDVPNTNYQEGCSIILRIDGLLQEVYS